VLPELQRSAAEAIAALVLKAAFSRDARTLT
jgi:hypothetical protein